MVINPVDVMARLPSATFDTARYRALLAAAYGIPRLVDGLVIGEHGDTAVCCLSTTALAAFTNRSMVIMDGVGRVRAGATGCGSFSIAGDRWWRRRARATVSRYGDQSWPGQPVRFIDRSGQPRLPALSELELQQIDAADQKLRGY